MNKMIFKLYVSGMNAYSDKIIASIKTTLTTQLEDQFDLYIIDVTTNTDLAEQDKILATPVLCRVSPLPEKRIIGDLTAQKSVLSALGVSPHEMAD